MAYNEMLQIRVIRLDLNRTFANCSNSTLWRSSCSFVIFCLPHTHIFTLTFMVPWQEPWAGDIYSGSWKSIGPARIQIKGSVTHQPYKGKQIFSLSWCRCILWTCVLGGKQITCWRGRGTEVVKALVLVAAPLLLHKLKRVSRGDLKGERKFLLMTLRSRRCESRKRKHIWKLACESE